jgi:O-antigen ligase
LVPAQLLSNVKIFLRLSVLAIMGATLFRLGSHPRHRKSIGYMLPFWVFASWALLSAVWSPLRQTTLGQAVSLFTLVSLASVIAIKWSGERATSAVLCCLALGTSACCILLLLCHVLLPAAGAMTRNHGGLLHPTSAGATASLGLIIVLASRLLWSWGWARRLCLPACLAYTAVLLISTNRLALVLALGLGLLMVLSFSDRFWFTAAVVVFSVLAAAYLVLDPGLELAAESSRTMTGYAGRDQSVEELSTLSGRYEMWEAMWASFAESPWIGHGYFVTSSTGELFVWYEWGNWTAHNLCLQLLVTTGIIGTTIFLGGILRLGSLVLAGALRRQVDWRTTAFLSVVAVWYLCWGLLNESIAGPLQPESVVFYACLGIAAGAAGSASSASLQTASASPGCRITAFGETQ